MKYLPISGLVLTLIDKVTIPVPLPNVQLSRISCKITKGCFKVCLTILQEVVVLSHLLAQLVMLLNQIASVLALIFQQKSLFP